jgi:hypothetical protein
VDSCPAGYTAVLYCTTTNFITQKGNMARGNIIENMLGWKEANKNWNIPYFEPTK